MRGSSAVLIWPGDAHKTRRKEEKQQRGGPLAPHGEYHSLPCRQWAGIGDIPSLSAGVRWSAVAPLGQTDALLHPCRCNRTRTDAAACDLMNECVKPHPASICGTDSDSTSVFAHGAERGCCLHREFLAYGNMCDSRCEGQVRAGSKPELSACN